MKIYVYISSSSSSSSSSSPSPPPPPQARRVFAAVRKSLFICIFIRY